MEIPDILAATVKFAPNGGVKKPISQVMTVNIPKKTGSIPNDVTSGKNTAVKSTICAKDSIKVPIKI